MNGSSSSTPVRRRWILALVIAAVALLVGEVVWFSPPVQDWWMSRQPLEKLADTVQDHPGSTRARYYYIQALLREGRTAEAWRQGQDAAHLDPNEPRLQSAAGVAAAADGQPDAATPLLTRAWELGDRSGETLERLGALHLAQDRLGPALQVLEECVRLHPRRAESWHLLGECRARLLMPDGWAEAMEKVAQLAPEDPRGWLGQAEAWLFKEQPERAISPARKAALAGPDDPTCQLVLARAEAAMQNPGTAEPAFQKALELANPNTREWHAASQAYGAFLLNTRQPAAAVRVLEALHAAQPDESATAYLLASALRADGRKEQARKLLDDFESASSRRRELRYLQARVAADPGNAELRSRLARQLRSP